MVQVAPRAGAWIEIGSSTSFIASISSHPVRVRGLKSQYGMQYIWLPSSHPVRVRGLKFEGIDKLPERDVSHPVRVRGLKSKALNH